MGKRIMEFEHKNRVYPRKPEWQIILDHIVYQDDAVLFRLSRKMLIYLNKLKVTEIYEMLNEFSPNSENNSAIQNVGPNWPKPKITAFVAADVINKVFDIADKYIPDEEITKLITAWLHKEKLSNLSRVLEKKNAPLYDVVDAINKYFRLGGTKEFTSLDERMGVRVSLIQRLLSDNLAYVNIAKHYIKIDTLAALCNKIIGPPEGTGKLGGKSAGMILAYEILKQKKKTNPKLENVFTPRSWFLSSDLILEFMNYNALDEFAFSKYQTQDSLDLGFNFLELVFKHSKFPPDMIHGLNTILDDMPDKPLVIRSSSLLEDSFEATFSGKYKSLFISNTGSKQERLASLIDAIVEVYASTFSPDPIAYRKEKGLLDFREEMGILIQEVVGNRVAKYFISSYAGVAMSNNEFRWSPRIKREDGVIRLVAGLGTRAVDRTMADYPVLISPGATDINANQTIKDKMRYCQHYVDVINMETNSFETISFEQLVKDAKGNIPGIENMVSFIRESTIVDPISKMSDFANENLIITFNNLINRSHFIPQIKEMLHELSAVYQTPVDIEFASDGDKLYLLQCRPQGSFKTQVSVKMPTDIKEQQKIFTASEYVNDGFFSDIQFVVFVDAKGYSALETIEEMQMCGKIIGRLNRMLPKRKFILIGPGRWGSKGDIKLGVPVIYSDINNTAMLIEVAYTNADYVPELSFGTHFFQDLVEADIKYLPLYPDKAGNTFNNEFFYNTPNSLRLFINDYEKYENVIRLIDLNNFIDNGALNIIMDGNKNTAIAYAKEDASLYTILE